MKSEMKKKKKNREEEEGGRVVRFGRLYIMTSERAKDRRRSYNSRGAESRSLLYSDYSSCLAFLPCP